MAASQKILELNAFDMRRKADLEPVVAKLAERRRRSFGPDALLFYEAARSRMSARLRVGI